MGEVAAAVKRTETGADELPPRGYCLERDPRARGFGWDSAFFRFAESVRTLTRGTVNYKFVYALVGVSGRYVNHASPIVRKRTAASLSRLMHSSRYATDLRESYQQDGSVFARAAHELAARARRAQSTNDAALVEAFIGSIWEEIRQGLVSEQLGGRDISLARVERETTALRAWVRVQLASDRAPLDELIAACFHMMAFGHLDERFARSLCSRTPVSMEGMGARPICPRADEACLIRTRPEGAAPVSGVWRLSADHPFSIGRYTDCDAIEVDPLISRVHCRVYRIGDAWYVEDSGSRYGTRVLRGTGPGFLPAVFDSRKPDASTGRGLATCRLEFGDCIELSGRVVYWFRSIDEDELI